jgi:uncharacterized protein with FMN-binding domain
VNWRVIIMKKIATLVITALVVSSISGCANRNTGYGNQNNMNRGINQGTTQGTRTGYGTTNMGTTQGVYRDGIYTGEGDRGGSGNQTATVVISGGRITDITLRTVDAQGRDISGTAAQGRTTAIIGNTDNTTGAPGARYFNTPGITAGGAAVGMGAGTITSPRGNTGYANGDYSFQNIGGDAGGMMGGIPDGTSGRTNTGWTTGGTGTGTGTSGVTGSFDRERTVLARRMIDQQSADVALNEIDTSEARNWKLAVRRALDKARTGGTTGGTTGVGTGAGSAR